MNDITSFQKIKTGFWLGVGFSLPLIIAFLFSIVLSMVLTPTIVDYTYKDNDDDEGLIEQIEITNYNGSPRGDRLLILGNLINKGPKRISSINLQAELFNKDGNFVLECDERVSRKMKSGDNENFQITCGCSKAPVPEYETLTVKVMSVYNH